MVWAGAKSHDIRRIAKKLCRPPLVVQWSDATADEIRPSHLQCDPDNGEAMDPGNGDRELLILGVGIAPVVSTNRRRLANLAKFLWVLLLNPAPAAPPLLPPLLLGASGYVPFSWVLGIQATQPEMAPPFWMRGKK